MAEQNESIVAEVDKDMAAAKVSREMANQINPLISCLWTEDTLQDVSNLVNEVGYLLSSTKMETESIYLVFSTAAAALDWERKNIRSAAQARKEMHRAEGESK